MMAGSSVLTNPCETIEEGRLYTPDQKHIFIGTLANERETNADFVE